MILSYYIGHKPKQKERRGLGHQQWSAC